MLYNDSHSAFYFSAEYTVSMIHKLFVFQKRDAGLCKSACAGKFISSCSVIVGMFLFVAQADIPLVKFSTD